MQRLYETFKLDVGLKPTSLATTNATGPYFSMCGHRAALVVLTAAAMAKTKTAKIEIFEAKDADGTDAQAIDGATATITALAGDAESTLTVASVVVADSVTINGDVYTAAAAADSTNLVFDQSGTDAQTATSLAAVINAQGADYVAEANSAVVTVKPREPGAVTIIITDDAATITPATVQAAAYVDLSHFDLSDGFDHIATKVTTDATIVVSVVLARGDPREGIVQHVSASAAL